MTCIKDLIKEENKPAEKNTAEAQEGANEDGEDSSKAESDVAMSGDDADESKGGEGGENHWEQYAEQQCADFVSYIDLSTVIDGEDSLSYCL